MKTKNTNTAFAKETKKLQKRFNSIFNLNRINRRPMVFELGSHLQKNVTLIESDYPKTLNPIIAGQVKTPINNLAKKQSGIYRQSIGYFAVMEIINNKTKSTQIFSSILNHALASLTEVLGSEVVTNNDNKLSVQFLDEESSAAIEMRIILRVE